MIVNIKKYVAKVSKFVEHEDGSITKEVVKMELSGKRFSPATVWKLIPRDCKLVESGWVETSYEVDTGKLENFCKENGKLIDNAITEY